MAVHEFCERTQRALARWPDVPGLYGWLRLDERGRWLLRGGVVTNDRIIDAICHNYSCDEHGCWFFQNGPQRGYVALDYTPLILFAQPDGSLITHTGKPVRQTRTALLDEAGGLVLATEHGPGLLHHADLDWALPRLAATTGEPEDALQQALKQDDGTATRLTLEAPGGRLPVLRCDRASVPAELGFECEPTPPE